MIGFIVGLILGLVVGLVVGAKHKDRVEAAEAKVEEKLKK